MNHLARTVGLGLLAAGFALTSLPAAQAQDAMQPADTMKPDTMKADTMKKKPMHAGKMMKKKKKMVGHHAMAK